MDAIKLMNAVKDIMASVFFILVFHLNVHQKHLNVKMKNENPLARRSKFLGVLISATKHIKINNVHPSTLPIQDKQQ